MDDVRVARVDSNPVTAPLERHEGTAAAVTVGVVVAEVVMVVV